MAYTQIPIVRGRLPHRSRVSARKSNDRSIIISLTCDLAQYIGADISSRIKIELGSDIHRGTLRLSAAAVDDKNCAAAYRDGRQARLNIRRDFLPDAIIPKRTITLPHELERDSIIVDITPLRSIP